MNDFYKILILVIIFVSIDLYNILYLSNTMYVNQYNKINSNQEGITMDVNKYLITILIYLSFAVSLYYLVFQTSTNLMSILGKSILLGLTISITYNGTNLITLNNYDYSVAFKDIGWASMILFPVSSLIAYFLIKD